MKDRSIEYKERYIEYIGKEIAEINHLTTKGQQYKAALVIGELMQNPYKAGGLITDQYEVPMNDDSGTAAEHRALLVKIHDMDMYYWLLSLMHIQPKWNMTSYLHEMFVSHKMRIKTKILKQQAVGEIFNEKR